MNGLISSTPLQLGGSLSMRVFETRRATGSELFSLLICLQTTTFTLLSIFSPLEMIRTKIWETPLSWYEKCPLPVAACVSKTRVLKLPPNCSGVLDIKPFISRGKLYCYFSFRRSVFKYSGIPFLKHL